jgi:hypothetical protein
MTDADPLRRRLLASAPWLAIIVLGGARLGQAAPRAAVNAAGSAAVHSLLAHVDSAVAVGREYLRHHPDERDLARIRHGLSGALGGPVETLDPAVLRERVRRRVRQDFAEDRIALVDGWILSITEARICALAALIDA